jgi:hypothetical protein
MISERPKITWRFLVPKLEFGNEKSGNLILDSYLGDKGRLCNG